LRFFLLLNDLLELFYLFGLHGVLDSNIKLCAFCYQWTHQEREIEKPSGQFLDLIVMSH
jgi:hypothetical protein